MDLENFREYCLTKPGAIEGMPFGPDTLVFKVGGKIFAIASRDDVPPHVNLKCDPERALDLRDRYEEVQPGYHMNKKHWNTVELSGQIPPNELCGMIDHSYDLVSTKASGAGATLDGGRGAARPRRSRAAKRSARPQGKHRVDQ